MKIRKIKTLLLALLSLPALVQAQFNYISTNGTATIVGYTGFGGDVTIPATIDGFTVTSIGGGAFMTNESLTSVTIPDTVTNIGIESFWGCSNLISVAIGNGVKSIDYAAFAYCLYLNDVTIPSNVISLADYAFVDTDVTNVNIPYGVTNIGYSTFGLCRDLVSVTIPNSVASIGSYAFAFSALPSVTIPGSVKSIADHAFADCAYLATAFFQSNAPPENLTIFDDDYLVVYYTYGANGWKSTFGGLPTALFLYPFGYAIQGGAVTITKYFGTNEDVTIAAAINGLPVRDIGYGAFGNCASITNLIIPGSVTSFEDNAFASCLGLTSVAIPGSVTNLGAWIFASCTNLTSVTIPSSVTSIGAHDFDTCLSLTNVTIPHSVVTIDDFAFFRSGLTSITIPATVTNISEYPFADCVDLQYAFFAGNAPTSIGAAFDKDVGDPVTVYYLPGTTGWSSIFGDSSTALWNPRAFRPSFSGGRFGFNITGPANAPIVIEASSDLSAPIWVPVSKNTLPASGDSSFSDLQLINSSNRFYRFRMP